MEDSRLANGNANVSFKDVEQDICDMKEDLKAQQESSERALSSPKGILRNLAPVRRDGFSETSNLRKIVNEESREPVIRGGVMEGIEMQTSMRRKVVEEGIKKKLPDDCETISSRRSLEKNEISNRTESAKNGGDTPKKVVSSNDPKIVKKVEERGINEKERGKEKVQERAKDNVLKEKEAKEKEAKEKAVKGVKEKQAKEKEAKEKEAKGKALKEKEAKEKPKEKEKAKEKENDVDNEKDRDREKDKDKQRRKRTSSKSKKRKADGDDEEYQRRKSRKESHKKRSRSTSQEKSKRRSEDEPAKKKRRTSRHHRTHDSSSEDEERKRRREEISSQISKLKTLIKSCGFKVQGLNSMTRREQLKILKQYIKDHEAEGLSENLTKHEIKTLKEKRDRQKEVAELKQSIFSPGEIKKQRKARLSKKIDYSCKFPETGVADIDKFKTPSTSSSSSSSSSEYK